MKVTIRRSRPGDGRGIARVQNEGWLFAYPNEAHGVTRKHVIDRGMESPEWIAKREARIAQENAQSQSWVALVDGTIVGWCVGLKGNERNEMATLYVLPAYHGKKIGKWLMQTVLAWLGHDKEIFLHVVAYNKQAIGFYEKFGFAYHCHFVYAHGPFKDGPNMETWEMVRPARSL